MKCPGKDEECGNFANNLPILRVGSIGYAQYIDISMTQAYCDECIKPRHRIHEFDEDEETIENFSERIENLPEPVNFHHLMAVNTRLWRQIELHCEANGFPPPSKMHVSIRWRKQGK